MLQTPSQTVGPGIFGGHQWVLFLIRFVSASVGVTVAIGAKGNQVFGSIVAKGTARTNMMHLEAFRSSATLASPSVSL